MERWALGYVLKRYQLALEWMRRSVSLLRASCNGWRRRIRFAAKRGRRSTLKALPALRRRLYRRWAGSAHANPRLRTFGYRGEAQIKRPRRHRVLSVRHIQKEASRAAGLSWSQTRRVAQGL
jgi:hypothetical protein